MGCYWSAKNDAAFPPESVYVAVSCTFISTAKYIPVSGINVVVFGRLHVAATLDLCVLRRCAGV